MNEVRITTNIWTSMTALSVVLLVYAVLSYSYYVKKLQIDYKRFTVFAAQMEKGCANPDNELATTKIGFPRGGIYSCTPFFRKRTAPKVADGRK